MQSKLEAGRPRATHLLLPIVGVLAALGAPAAAQPDLPLVGEAAQTRSGPPPAPPDGHRGPPPGAYEACEGKHEEAACRVSFPDREIQGTCVYGPEDKLFCLPDEPPPPPPARPPEVL